MSLQRALEIIDAGHSEDPTKLGDGTAYELHYARKCSAYLSSLTSSTPGDALQIAVRAQHYRRWELPRSAYPLTRAGYLTWRTLLKKRAGELAADACRSAGYDEDTCARVAALVRKENLKKDADTQTLEDVACLVFLDDQFEAFNAEHDEDKIVNILRKTWAKMSDAGHQLALKVHMSDECQRVVAKALAG